MIVERIPQDPADAYSALMVLRCADPDIDWGPFAEAAAHWLREAVPSQGMEPQLTSNESRSLLRFLLIERHGLTPERAELVSEGVALEYVWLATQEGDTVALGDWLYEELRQFSPESWANRGYSGYAHSGKELVDALLTDPSTQPHGSLVQAIEQRRDFDVIASIGAYADKLLASALLSELWESESFRTALNGDRFPALWLHIARAAISGALDLHALVRAACAHPMLATDLREGPFAEDLMGMYAAVVIAHPDRGEAALLAERAATSLSALSLGQWRTAMDGSDDWLTLLGAVRGTASDARVAGAFGQALVKFVEQVAEGEDVATAATEQWESVVVPLLAPAVEGTYAEGVGRTAVNVGGGLPGAFFALVGDTLKDPRIFLRSDILDGLLPDLVTERNASALSWLIDALQDGDVRRNAPPNAFGALAEVVRTSHGEDQDYDHQLRQIAELIDLDLGGWCLLHTSCSSALASVRLQRARRGVQEDRERPRAATGSRAEAQRE